MGNPCVCKEQPGSRWVFHAPKPFCFSPLCCLGYISWWDVHCTQIGTFFAHVQSSQTHAHTQTHIHTNSCTCTHTHRRTLTCTALPMSTVHTHEWQHLFSCSALWTQCWNSNLALTEILKVCGSWGKTFENHSTKKAQLKKSEWVCSVWL